MGESQIRLAVTEHQLAVIQRGIEQVNALIEMFKTPW